MKLAFDLYIAAPADRVWSAITDGNLTQGYFFNSKVKSTFQPGAPIDWSMGDVKMIDGKVVSIEKGQKLVVSQRALWNDKVAKDPAAEVTWQVTRLGPSTTKLTLVHDGLEANSAT